MHPHEAATISRWRNVLVKLQSTSNLPTNRLQLKPSDSKVKASLNNGFLAQTAEEEKKNVQNQNVIRTKQTKKQKTTWRKNWNFNKTLFAEQMTKKT